MSPAHRNAILAAVLGAFAVTFGSVAARVFFGLSKDHMMVGLGTGLVILIATAMLSNWLMHGVWIKRETTEQRAVLDAGLKRAWWGYALGSLVMLPAVFVLIILGSDSGTATHLSVLVGAIVATVLFARHMMRQRKPSA